jgi:hypothetical protein
LRDIHPDGWLGHNDLPCLLWIVNWLTVTGISSLLIGIIESVTLIFSEKA